MKAMRCFLGLICCVSLAAAGAPQRRQLQEKSQFFELREALQQAGSNDPENPFYRGLVALTPDETASLKNKRDETGSAGEIVSRKIQILPTLRLNILGRPTELKQVTLVSSH